ncbi:MAG: CRISPR system precrRNA processing endoribonuclease RAMP protein Cas6 [Magnetococcales bacterium]|nr:CRISPR system precrRNA processing endoribonuclease RAMP protein Cas6 [Magnetococcales bacterium]MBF0149792.1 CRISPR system precrRNA processing endoribonuclease RAMP protein Cas6 [Magnetococcales bacterium]MBF0348690.1 CRISPR system precrRNA processing endoribonuclease RAMP protein Cas6 [Magnetococcales bacterium]
MTGLSLFSCPLGRYRFEWRVRTPLRLPEYSGSALRGSFGGALRQLGCMAREPVCTGCMMIHSCPYATIFETPPPKEATDQTMAAVVPHPYVIEPPPWGRQFFAPGETLVFHLILAGRALEQLPLVVLAWQRALAKGVGPGMGTADLQCITWEGASGATTVFTAEEGILHPHAAREPVPPWPGGDRLTLELLTPTRIQKEGKPLGPGRLHPRDFLVTLMRRVSQMARIHCDHPWPMDPVTLARSAQGITSHGNLSWRDWTRRSSRQGRNMALGGVVGHWTLVGDLRPFWELLYLGEWLHVGKNATFGLGGYRLRRGENG